MFEQPWIRVACAVVIVSAAVGGCAVGFPGSLDDGDADGGYLPKTVQSGKAKEPADSRVEQPDTIASKPSYPKPDASEVDGGEVHGENLPAPSTQDAALPPPDAQDSGPAMPAGECSGDPTRAGCLACCDAKHPKGRNVGFNAYGYCVCSWPGKCANSCQYSWCSGHNPQQGSFCDQCLTAQDKGYCAQVGDNACAKNAECSKIKTCQAESACASKP